MQKKILVVICSFIVAMAVFFCGWYVCNTLYQQTISQISNETSEDVKELRTQLAQAIFERNALIQANYDETSEEVQALDEKITSIKSQIEVLEGTLRAELAEALAERDALIKANYDETSAELQAVNARITELENQIEVANSNISNENLLINGDFRVNQRGQTSYTGTGIYTFDRWIKWFDGTATKQDDVLVLNNTGENSNVLQQIVEDEALISSNLTLSINVSTNNIDYNTISCSGVASDGDFARVVILGHGGIEFGVNSTGLVYVNILVESGKTLYVKWAKLEYGSTATSYNPRLYAEELALCQRYWKKIAFNNITGHFSFNNENIYMLEYGSMRALPTITLNEIGRWLIGNGIYKDTSSLTLQSTDFWGGNISDCTVSYRLVWSSDVGFGGNVLVVCDYLTFTFDAEIY